MLGNPFWRTAGPINNDTGFRVYESDASDDARYEWHEHGVVHLRSEMVSSAGARRYQEAPVERGGRPERPGRKLGGAGGARADRHEAVWRGPAIRETESTHKGSSRDPADLGRLSGHHRWHS